MKRFGLNLQGRCMMTVIDAVDAARDLGLEPVEEYDKNCDRFILRFLYQRPDRHGRMKYAELGDIPIEVSSDGVEIINVAHLDYLLQRMPAPLPMVHVADSAPHEHQHRSHEAMNPTSSDLGEAATEEHIEGIDTTGEVPEER